MITRFISRASRHSKVLKNFSYLSIVQVFNTVLFPLITYPFLIRVLGVESYGLVVFAQNFISYFTVVINYGFNLSSVRDIANQSQNLEKKSEIVSAVYIIKLLFTLISFSILGLLLLYVPVFKENYLIYFYSATIWISEVFFPIWYFQGMQNMKYITIINVGVKFIVLGLLFMVVDTKSDFLLVPIIYGIGALLSAIYSIYILVFKEGIRLYWVGLDCLFLHIKESSVFFISGLSALIKDRSNLFFIGILLGMKEVAVYDIVNKVINLVLAVLFNISNVMFPYFSQKKDPSFSRKVVAITLAVSILSYLSIIVFGTTILGVISKKDLLEGAYLFKYLGLLIVLSPLSALFGTILLSNNHSRFLPKNLVLSTIVYFFIVLCLFLTKHLTLTFFILAVVLSVLFELFNRIWYIRKFQLLNWLYK